MATPPDVDYQVVLVVPGFGDEREHAEQILEEALHYLNTEKDEPGMRFAYNVSARLEIVSGHRSLPHADAVILMGESCVLGPKWQNHVVCREWNGDVVLYRSEERIMCRAMESVEIDGKLHDGRGPVRPGSHVVGGDFSFSLEAV